MGPARFATYSASIVKGTAATVTVAVVLDANPDRDELVQWSAVYDVGRSTTPELGKSMLGSLTKVKKKKKMFMMPNAKLVLSMEQFLLKLKYG